MHFQADTLAPAAELRPAIGESAPPTPRSVAHRHPGRRIPPRRIDGASRAARRKPGRAAADRGGVERGAPSPGGSGRRAGRSDQRGSASLPGEGDPGRGDARPRMASASCCTSARRTCAPTNWARWGCGPHAGDGARGDACRAPAGSCWSRAQRDRGSPPRCKRCCGASTPARAALLTIEDRADGPSIAEALRAALRQDPDVILVPRVSDRETAAAAVQAAEAGHLVLAAMPVGDAVAAILRLRELRVEPFQLASTLQAVIAQRLVRRLCSACRQPVQAPRSVSALLGFDAGRWSMRPAGATTATAAASGARPACSRRSTSMPRSAADQRRRRRRDRRAPCLPQRAQSRIGGARAGARGRHHRRRKRFGCRADDAAGADPSCAGATPPLSAAASRRP